MEERQQEQGRQFLTVKELAQTLRIGLTSARTLTMQPDFPAIRIGRRVVVPVDELDQWARRQCGGGGAYGV